MIDEQVDVDQRSVVRVQPVIQLVELTVAARPGLEARRAGAINIRRQQVARDVVYNRRTN